MGVMEQTQIENLVATDELATFGEDLAEGLEFVGFDSLAPTEPEPIDRESGPVGDQPARTKARRRRRATTRARPHAVRLCFDDREILKLTGSAEAAGIALPEYLRGRVLKDQRSRGQQAAPPGSVDLFAPVMSAPPLVERGIPPLSADMEERVDTYYALRDGFNPAAHRYGRRPNRVARLAYLLVELVRVRPLGDRAMPREGA